MMSSAGKVIRIPASQIPCIGRATQGVTLMRFEGAEEVVAMTVADVREEPNGNGLIDLNGDGSGAA
ncbi:MAG TPA: DNA gyrase C-terminal beta-propeller domain-containing protein, partial [Thermomicrobiales bacterium]|nr:DNA gyrase C-terminal beta-propeller domain-containing protein [Thermomicrobiales bacterium]